MSKVRQAALTIVTLAASIALLHGQGSDLGAIRGAVTDPAGASVPNATVVITDIATGSTVTVRSNEEGEFEAPAMRSGTYSVRVSATGFNILEISRVVLTPGANVRADARLQVSTSTEQVVVRSEAPLIQTDSPSASLSARS